MLTHAVEPLESRHRSEIDAYLPAYEPRQVLDPDDPMTIGAMVGPEAFTEVRYLAHAKQMQALDSCRSSRPSSRRVRPPLGRPLAPLPHRRRQDDPRRARLGARHDRGRRRRAARRGRAIGALGITCFRPFPIDEVRDALAGADRVVVVESAFAVGIGGIVGQNVRLALSGLPPDVYDVVAGLGGRPSPALTARADRGRGRGGDRAQPPHFLDLDWKLVERELQRRRRRAARGRTRRTSSATSASSPGGHTDGPSPRSSSSRSAASRWATGCSRRTSGRCRPDVERTNALT